MSSTGSSTPTPDPASRPMDIVTAALLIAVAILLVAGYIVLALAGKDTSTYVVFIGGPAVTGIVGTIVARRVTGVQAVVAATSAETHDVVKDARDDIQQHLSEQDRALRTIHKGVRAASGTADEDAQIPLPRHTDTAAQARIPGGPAT